jgi:DNA-binding MurR/RpiR family transcriptional regulator
MDLYNQLKSSDNLNENEKVISNYLLNNLTKIPKMNIDKLAKETYSSKSSIVRFSKKLGYDGFKSLKIKLIELEQTILFSEDAVDVNFPFDINDSTEQIIKKIADLSINSIKRTLSQLNSKIIDEASVKIYQAQNIFIFSKGDSQIRARSFQSRMVKLGKFAILAEEYSDEFWVSENIGINDCAIFITYGLSDTLYEKIIEKLYKKGVTIILITGNNTSKVIDYCSAVLTISRDEEHYAKVSTFSSQISFDLILNILFSKIYAITFKK